MPAGDVKNALIRKSVGAILLFRCPRAGRSDHLGGWLTRARLYVSYRRERLNMFSADVGPGELSENLIFL